ncbi:Response regulator receiver domain-containing protein [Methylobacterium sp. UNC378MF]|uniref:DNA-binding response regulator n=1 Tax=Methylobacterium oryzae TaxID=334852 RepID=A0ABU7TMY8_9HYPH|nr:response regulator transcription factor [Methylobacterium sp. UNC378MF]SDA17350.1 Response regulator receiver domain-containing protein [Methylobacterium sp. UNC378MF]
MKILAVEDDAPTLALLVSSLEEAGHVVEQAGDGQTGLRLARETAHDVAVVDRMLPGLDGLELVRQLRALGVQTPVLFLTTMGGISDRVDGLEAGGDDYLVKPFALAELLARINALARRPPLGRVETIIRVANVELDLVTRRVTRAGHVVDLQPREFSLLEFLMRNVGQLVTRRQLLESVWDFHFDPRTNIVETHMSRLRAKLNSDGGPDPIETVRGSGYILHADIS